MKTLLTLMAAASLAGCAVYPVPVYDTHGGPSPVYVEPPPIYFQGIYRSRGQGPAHPRGYHRPAPVIVPPPHRPPRAGAPGRRWGDDPRDRDRDDRRPDQPSRR